MIVHALYLIIVKPPKRFAERKAEANAAAIPEHVPRHSLAARLFHWIMAASMFTLLFTAFLPKVGIQFNWVVYHWIAGLVLTVSILFHIVHATFFLDFWSIWPDKTDLSDAKNRVRRFFGKDAPLPNKFAKYPLENKLYHGVILLAGLAVIGTGLFMMKRVQTGIFVRNPYLFQRYDVGPDVRAARTGRSGADRAGDGACVHGNPAGEVADYEVDDLWLDEPGFLS